MRVIGVIDLRNGRAVRAYGGRRDDYQVIGDAVDLARRYVEHYKLPELYVADLDAIESAGEAEAETAGSQAIVHRRDQTVTIRHIAKLGVPVWLDAGVSSIKAARQALDLGATRVVVGLETLPSFHTLRSICAAIGGGTVAFSLDLRDGEPVADRAIPREAPEQLAARAAEAGARTIIVLDLARVGTRAGVDVDLLGRVRKAVPGPTLLAGGGVRGPEDLDRLAELGCDGVLVATAIDALYPRATR